MQEDKYYYSCLTDSGHRLLAAMRRFLPELRRPVAHRVSCSRTTMDFWKVREDFLGQLLLYVHLLCPACDRTGYLPAGITAYWSFETFPSRPP